MRTTRDQNNNRLTSFDRHLVTRISYAMVVTGIWARILPRRCESFDYYEIVDGDGRPRYRVGRYADGKYALLDLRSGLQRHDRTIANVLGDVAYVPNSLVVQPRARS